MLVLGLGDSALKGSCGGHHSQVLLCLMPLNVEGWLGAREILQPAKVVRIGHKR